MTNQFLISIVFSFRNEVEVLEELLDRTEVVFDNEKIPYELIFVNDASVDKSLQVLTARREANPAIKIINMSRRFGNGPCVLAGLEHSSGDAVIYMDSDLQDPPELIPLLIDIWREGNDIVHPTRINRLGESRFKMWITSGAYRVINLLSEVEIPRNSGDFKLLSRRAVDAVLKIKELDPFVRGLSLYQFLIAVDQVSARFLR